MLVLGRRSNKTYSIQFVRECVHLKYHYFQLLRRILKLRYIDVRLAVLRKARRYTQVLHPSPWCSQKPHYSCLLPDGYQTGWWNSGAISFCHKISQSWKTARKHAVVSKTGLHFWDVLSSREGGLVLTTCSQRKLHLMKPQLSWEKHTAVAYVPGIGPRIERWALSSDNHNNRVAAKNEYRNAPNSGTAKYVFWWSCLTNARKHYQTGAVGGSIAMVTYVWYLWGNIQSGLDVQ